MDTYESLNEKAILFAKEAHKGQKRKYTDEDYIIHPLSVADKCTSYTAKTVAVLHDTVEDTQITLTDIRKEFGDLIAEYVWWLTDETEGNRETRKLVQRVKLAKAPQLVRSVKKFDLIDNAKSIHKYDPDFWKVFKREARDLLKEIGAYYDKDVPDYLK